MDALKPGITLHAKNDRRLLRFKFPEPDMTAFVSAIRLNLGKLLVNLLQVVKRTNTPLIP